MWNGMHKVLHFCVCDLAISFVTGRFTHFILSTKCLMDLFKSFFGNVVSISMPFNLPRCFDPGILCAFHFLPHCCSVGWEKVRIVPSLALFRQVAVYNQ